jgi:hypothetical protein
MLGICETTPTQHVVLVMRFCTNTQKSPLIARALRLPYNHELSDTEVRPLRPTSGILAIAIGSSVACGGRMELVTLSTTNGGVGSSDMGSTSGSSATGGALGTIGARNTGGAGGQLDTRTGPSSNTIPVCIYSESGPEHTITVHTDDAKSHYYLAGALFDNGIACPVGVDNPLVFEHVFDEYETLRVRTQSNGLIRFVDGTQPTNGPGYATRFLCTVNGIGITQRSKDSTLYVQFTRADGGRYRADVTGYSNAGFDAIAFYPMDSAATTVIGTRSATVSYDADYTATVTFLDMDDRRITIQITSYSQIIDVTTTDP